MAEFDPDKYLEKKKSSDDFDPDKYLASTKPETALQTFGRSSASLADSALNAVTGTLDWAAYPLARVAGKTPDQAQQETTSPKDVFGRMFGVTGTPGYENAPLRRLGTAVGETVGENVIQPISNYTGLPQQDVANMVTSATMGVAPMIPKAAGAVTQGAKTVAAPVMEFGRGATGVATGTTAKPGVSPEIWQQRSSRIPAAETYYPAQSLEQWRSGQISTPELQQAQTKWTPQQIEQLQRTRGNVPVVGEVARAAGEQFMEPLTNWKGWLPELAAGAAGGMVGGPGGAALGAGLALGKKAYSAVQGARQINAMNQLGGLKFTPQTSGEMAAIQSGTPHPVAGPIAPATNPAQFSQNLAAQKLAEQQSSWQQRAGAGYQPPTQQPQPVPTQPRPAPRQVAPQPIPKVEGMRSSSDIRSELNNISRQSDELHSQGLAGGIKYGTPEGERYQSQLGQLNARTKVLEKELKEALEAEKKATKTLSKKKGPSNVSQMLIEDTSKKVYPSKEAFEKESIFSTLKGEPHTGSYIQGDKIIHIEKRDYGSLPKDITRDFEQTKMYATDKNGNRVPIGKDWTSSDPEPLTSKVRRKLGKD